MRAIEIIALGLLIVLALTGLGILYIMLNSPVSPEKNIINESVQPNKTITPNEAIIEETSVVCPDKSLLVSYSFSENKINNIPNFCGPINGTVAADRTAPTWVNTSYGGGLRFVKKGSRGDCIDTGIGIGKTYSEITYFVCAISNSAGFGVGNFMNALEGPRILGYDSGTIVFEVPNRYYETTQSYLGAWHCYSLACGNSQCDAYIDSQRIATMEAPATISPTSNVHVGCRKYTNNQGETVNADITEARFYSRKLSQKEIVALYNNLSANNEE